MTTLTRIPAKLLSCRRLPHADPRLTAALGLPPSAAGRSLALMTCDQDDSLYAALDHATKMADVEVIYARSFYAGSAHASGPLSGEILGVIAGAEPESVEQGVRAVEFGCVDDLKMECEVVNHASSNFQTAGLSNRINNIVN